MRHRHCRPGLTALVALLTGCGLLDTSKPDIIAPGDLDNAEGAQARYFAAIANFGLARDGNGDVAASTGTEGQVILSGLMADEFMLSTTPPGEQEVDQRQVSFETNGTALAFFTLMQKSRLSAEAAATALQRFSDDSTADPRIPEMFALAGYSYLYFAEDFCSGVPYSTTSGSRQVFDTSHTTIETLALAVARFDSALASPTLPPEVEYLARIGKARALLDLGTDSAPAAAALLGGVPTTFSYDLEHAPVPAYLRNAVYTYGQSSFISVSDLEGGAGLPYRDDTLRVKTDSVLDASGNVVPGLDLSTPQFTLRKYLNESASIPVASGLEARLIEAEEDLLAGQYGTMNGILNALRSQFQPALPSLPVPASQTEAEDQLFAERAFWLFATGHRLGDMRRLVRQYGRAVTTVFPSGPYLKGGDYGSNVSLPIPFEADNNPRFDRSLCDPDAP
jgi:hypothetical protein